MRGDVEPLFEAARQWAKRNYGAAVVPISVQLNLSHGLTPIVLAAPAAAPPSAEESFQIQPGRGFRSLRVGKNVYPFTATQARAVELLYDAWESGAPDVPDSELLQAARTEAVKVSDLFRGSAAWGTLITEGGSRGTHRLVVEP